MDTCSHWKSMGNGRLVFYCFTLSLSLRRGKLGSPTSSLLPLMTSTADHDDLPELEELLPLLPPSLRRRWGPGAPPLSGTTCAFSHSLGLTLAAGSGSLMRLNIET